MLCFNYFKRQSNRIFFDGRGCKFFFTMKTASLRIVSLLFRENVYDLREKAKIISCFLIMIIFVFVGIAYIFVPGYKTLCLVDEWNYKDKLHRVSRYQSKRKIIATELQPFYYNKMVDNNNLELVDLPKWFTLHDDFGKLGIIKYKKSSFVYIQNELVKTNKIVDGINILQSLLGKLDINKIPNSLIFNKNVVNAVKYQDQFYKSGLIKCHLESFYRSYGLWYVIKYKLKNRRHLIDFNKILLSNSTKSVDDYSSGLDITLVTELQKIPKYSIEFSLNTYLSDHDMISFSNPGFIEIIPGESVLTFINVESKWTEPIEMMATVTILPEGIAPYIRKIECFCFNNLIINSYDIIELPMLLELDPKIITSAQARKVETIRIEYTFHLKRLNSN